MLREKIEKILEATCMRHDAIDGDFDEAHMLSEQAGLILQACREAYSKNSPTPRQLHRYYLEAIGSGVAGNEYNPKAIELYDDLTDKQKAIDKYISKKIRQKTLENMK